MAARVRLVAPRLQDRPEFLELVEQSIELHRPWTYPPADSASFRRLLERNRGDDFFALFARRAEDEAIVGLFEFSAIVRGSFQNAYLGYWVGAPYAAQGYMRDGMQAALRFAFNELRLHRVEANIQPANTRSLALAKKAGFRREGFSPRYLKIGGRWRDHERWAILADELRGRR
ncbi:MAG: [ribosomal protein S5]-alanine N-acetyltransferase [Thermoleophilaceae bacterium]|jgi:ribosomal-protein-alanine N-acetyltransferase|nr:[ribosomal protein S5]-alanine N-acetyltransferase [Thermoleophilaceae bacterium]